MSENRILELLQSLYYWKTVEFNDTTFGKYGVKLNTKQDGAEYQDFVSFFQANRSLVAIMRVQFTNMKNRHHARIMYLNNLFCKDESPSGCLYVNGDTLWMECQMPYNENVPEKVVCAFMEQTIRDSDKYLKEYLYPNLSKILE
ncbi:MAG: hypothetical protein IJT98_00490 [Prevotella sp.]|nr:hypothetical protein [Prevotella sp.]